MKPLDFGGGGVTGSVNADGRLIALNFYHPQHGYVTLTSAEPFPEAERYHPAAVRAYRAGLAAQDGYGLRLSAPVTARRARLLASAVPEIELEAGGERASVTTFASARGALQQIAAPPGARWGGRLSLQRCAYTQLTEGGPVPMPPLRLHVAADAECLILHNPELGAAVAILGLDLAGLTQQRADTPLALDFPLLSSGRLAYGVGLTVAAAAANARWLSANADLAETVAEWDAALAGLPDDPLVRRGIVYARMTAVPVEAGTCLLTDHMLLPLSWNRDAYYAARALLSAGQTDIVRRHLLWTFETAERPASIWARCYLANGRVKDSAFQLDQQLYPLLELADYLVQTGDAATAAQLTPQVEPLLSALEPYRQPRTLLYRTAETPADDPIALPYHLSSHILLWHTLRRLAALGLAAPWTARLAELHAAIQQTFICDFDGARLYAYAADGAGHVHRYHDANDLPLALAPAWGFVTADDPVWRSTLAFAFSAANRGGWYAGHLGSVHSPAPWALGDVQALVSAQARGDHAGVEQARAALCHAAQADGALPEAYNADDGSVYSRHWFVWPNAALACAELGAFQA